MKFIYNRKVYMHMLNLKKCNLNKIKRVFLQGHSLGCIALKAHKYALSLKIKQPSKLEQYRFV